MVAPRDPQHLRSSDLQQLILHVLCNRRRPSFVKYLVKPMSILFIQVTSSSPGIHDVVQSIVSSAPIRYTEAIPVPVVLMNIMRDLSPGGPDLSVISPSTIELSEKHSMESLFRYSLYERDTVSNTMGINEPLDKLFTKFVRPVRTTEHFLVAVDCEMVRTENGTALGRVTLLDHTGNVLYDEYVKPEEKVKDYLKTYSGLTPEILDKGVSFKQAQQDVLRYIGRDTHILGHGLEHDLNALQLYSCKVIDTASLYQSTDGYKIQLGQLSKSILKKEIQVGEHNSVEDALCCLELFSVYLKTKLVLSTGAGALLDVDIKPDFIEDVREKEWDCCNGLFCTVVCENDLSSPDLSKVCSNKKVLICFIYELEGEKYIALQRTD